MTPFSLAPCQLTANAPVGSDSPGPGRLTHLPPHPGDDLLKIFNRLPGKNSSSPPNFSLRIWTLGLFECVGGSRLHATSRHRAESAIPGCYRRPGRLSAPKSSPTAAPAHGQPGAAPCPRLHPPSVPRIRAVHPRPGIFPCPPGVGSPGPLSPRNGAVRGEARFADGSARSVPGEMSPCSR